jgi:hypothetical protein
MRRTKLILLALLAVLVGGDALVWQWAERQIETQFDAWTRDLGTQGWTVTHGPTRRGGWPLAARLGVPDLAIAAGNAAWRGDHVTIEIDALHPTTLLIGADAPLHAATAGLPEIAIEGDLLQGSVPLQNPDSVDIAGDRLRVTLPSGELTITRIRLHGELTATAARFGGTAGDIALPPPGHGETWPLGSHIASIAIDGTLTGAIPALPVSRRRAAQWRAAGGHLDIPHVALGWGPLGITGDLSGGLDANLQPTGSGTVRIIGYNATLDSLVAARAINAREATAARAVLGLLARAPQGGGEPETSVPVTLQDQRLAVAGFPLARLPEIAWPDAEK